MDLVSGCASSINLDELENQEIVITSANYPSNYSVDTTEEWHFHSQAGNIAIEFVHFHVS